MMRFAPVRLAGLLWLAAAPAFALQAEEAAKPVPGIILPGAPLGALPGAAPALILPQAGALTLPSAQIIQPEAPKLVAPEAKIVTAARPLTEQEAAPDKLPGKGELAALAKSLSPDADRDGGAPDAARASKLAAAFDGSLAPEAAHWDDLSADFARGARPPEPAVTLRAARSLIARLLPSLYRRVPAGIGYDRSEHPSTGHVWSEKSGHVIELAPLRSDARGDVESAFGAPGRARVQEKVERLMEVSHEYLHVIFDAVVGRRADHPMHSAYAAVTEGFAVGGEQLLVERLLDHAPALGLGPRETMDLSTLAAARREWLDTEDTHYAEGLLAWRDAYARGGLAGLSSLLASLSARRMAAVPRSDPAYQLALGDHELLAAYLGGDAAAPARRGLEAFAKAARGETLSAQESAEAAGVASRAGPEAWRRLFERTLLSDRRLKEPSAARAGGNWWEKDAEPAPSVEAAFALARLDPEAGAALARFLAATISEKGGAARLFGRPGPNPLLQAVAAGAEALPWDPASRKAWDAGLTRWLLAVN